MITIRIGVIAQYIIGNRRIFIGTKCIIDRLRRTISFGFNNNGYGSGCFMSFTIKNSIGEGISTAKTSFGGIGDNISILGNRTK